MSGQLVPIRNPGRISKEDWVSMAMGDIDRTDAAGNVRNCTRISVCHMQGELQKEVHSISFAGKQLDPKVVADTLIDRAKWHCQDLPGAQTFVLLAFYGQTHPECELPFMMHGQNQAVGLMTESPDEKGMRMMTMRHVEFLGAGYFRGHQIVTETQQVIIRDLLGERQQMRAEIRDSWQIATEAMLRAITSNNEHELKKLEYARKSAERARFLQFLPAIANRIFQREVFPQSTEDTAIIEGICDRLTEEQILQLGAVLPPELMGPLSDRLKAYQDKKNREARERGEENKALAAAGDPIKLGSGD